MIAHLVEDLRIGGQERIIEILCQFLHRRGLPVHVLCLSRGGDIADRLRSQGIGLDVLGLGNYHRPGALKRVVDWLRRKKVRIVHTHGIPAGILGRVAGRLAGAALVHHYHSLSAELLPRHKWKEWWMGGLTPRILCVSRAVVLDTLRLGIAPWRLRLIPNGVPPVSDVPVQEIRERLGIPAQDLVIGNVASLAHFKGPHLLIDAMVGLPSCHLFLVGAGRALPELQQRILAHGLQARVKLLGLQPETDTWHRLFDIFALPSLREGLPLGLLESMSCGRPAVVSDVGGMPEAVRNGENGIVVPSGDVESLRDALARLVADGKLRQRMGEAARERYLREFSAERMVQGVLGVYQELWPELGRQSGH